MQDYEWFTNHTIKQRRKRTKLAKQSEANRRPNPQGDFVFEEQWFMDYSVIQAGKFIRLCTYRQYNKSLGPPKGLLVMFHGLNSHIGHGAHIAHAFQEIGIVTVGFDHRGFGNSEGVKGYIDSLDLHLQDSLWFVMKAKQLYPQLPLFVLGLSMGGMTSYYLSLINKGLFKGVIMMAPAIGTHFSLTFVQLVRVISKLLPDRSKLTRPVRGTATKNPQVTQDVDKDKLAYSGSIRLQTANIILSTMHKASHTYTQYNAPFVVIQGGLDKLVDADAAYHLYQYSTSTDKQLWYYENMWHDVWHEQEIFDIIGRLKVWLAKRML